MVKAQTAILIGQHATCHRLEQQLALMERRPISLGWILTELSGARNNESTPVLGTVSELDAIIARRRPAVALVSLPAVMNEQILSIRTRLRKLGIPDRFMPTLEDQVAGIGPRTHLTIDYADLLDRPPRHLDIEAIREVLEGRRVLVTGAGGSIGSELARIASRFDPAQLILMDRSESALFEIDRQIARLAPELPRRAVLHDVVDAVGTLEYFEQLRPEVIFHTAAHKHVPMMEDHPAAAVDNNLFGTRSVADASDAVNAARFVMISSDKAVNPVSIMGATKRLSELYVQHLNLRSDTQCTTVRFGNVLASSGSVLEIWSRQIADGGPLTVTDPRMTRYFMTIPEAASLVIQAAALAETDVSAGEVFLLDMGEPIRILSLAEQFIRLHGLEPRLPGERPSAGTVGAIDIHFTGMRPGERLYEELAFDAECMRPTQHPDINIWTLLPPDDRYIEEMVRVLAPERRERDPVRLARIIWRLLEITPRVVAA